MDHPDNKKTAKNLIQRFLKIKHRLQERPSPDAEAEAPTRRDVFDSPRSSFRRSLKRMHTKVKSCIFAQEAGSPQRHSPEPPCVPERPESSSSLTDAVPQSPVRENCRRQRVLTDEIISLSNSVWYWGPMATSEAEERLRFKPDGTFLVRDSSSRNYLFSISFRSVGKTMHARIEYSCGKYNLCHAYYEGFPTVTELIEDAMKTSENGVLCYSKRGEYECEFPVRLTKPISRYTEVRSLKYLCKFVIRQNTNINDIPELPLPSVLHEYLLEKPYF